MKRYFFITCLLLLVCGVQAQVNSRKYTILLTGASFAAPKNTWFEMACEELNAVPLNRAVNGESVAVAANRMAEGKLFSPDELEKIDALVIMHVHDRNVCDEASLLPRYQDYRLPFDYSTYAPAYDYIIKRYISDCYELRNNPDSRYYKSLSGKPPVIVFCTPWHDSRPLICSSLRRLSAKWGIPLVEFDKYIGFSKNAPHPPTGQQTSLIYSIDSEVIDGVKFGWHPIRGRQSYIQQRMAAIFVSQMRRILPLSGHE